MKTWPITKKSESSVVAFVPTLEMGQISERGK